jgi:hypothetical protein
VDVFRLQHLLECNILNFQEELEEVTNAAVKEEQIEGKLNGIESDWAALTLVSPTRECARELLLRDLSEPSATTLGRVGSYSWRIEASFDCAVACCNGCCRCLLTTRPADL